MKAILMSIRPEWVAKILNGEKTIEIRKKFPKDYVGWVYIYCCKQIKNEIGCHINYEKVDGKVVARFWCDKVEEIYNKLIREITNDYSSSELPISTVAQMSCLTKEKLLDYVGDNGGYAIHIANLEIFNKPKEISEFKCCLLGHNNCVPHNCQECPATKPLTRAPQSWCYVEI